MPGRGARSGVDIRRAGSVLLLVVIAAVGLRAGGAFSAAGGKAILGLSGRALYWGLVVTEIILAVAGLILLVARLVWSRKGGDGLPERKRRSIWWILLLPLFVFGTARIIAKLRGHGFGVHGAAGAHGAGGAGGAAAHHQAGSSWLVLALFLTVALVAGVVTVLRHRRSAAPAVEEPAPDPAPEPLAEALAAGAQALRENPDPRTAIIGCYAAMEHSLAEAGSSVVAADTPAEVLARATTDGLVRSAWAGTLTGLFRRARYSSHPMTEADRTTAMNALAQVRADLGSVT
jgi:Domain of unknown function (DUF4129)